MPERTAMEKAVLAALEREPEVNLHRSPVQIQYHVANRTLTLAGEVGDIAAKRRACACASRVTGVDRVIDQLRVRRGEARGDGAIRTSITQAILGEPALRDCSLRAHHKGAMETLRAAPGSSGTIDVTVADGVVELAGHAGSLSHMRLAGALAWWTPGCCDVRNLLAVEPPEDDNDDEIADALRLVLEKDRFIPHADDILIGVNANVVTLSGVVTTAEERHLAEYDAWYVSGVRDVVNSLEVRRAAATK